MRTVKVTYVHKMDKDFTIRFETEVILEKDEEAAEASVEAHRVLSAMLNGLAEMEHP